MAPKPSYTISGDNINLSCWVGAKCLRESPALFHRPRQHLSHIAQAESVSFLNFLIFFL